jgi:replicative DNA helicase
MIDETWSRIEKMADNGGGMRGTPSGFKDLDTKLSGFHNSDLVIIAGRPGMGKTAFAINFAFNACRSLLKKTAPDLPPPSVGFFSLE